MKLERIKVNYPSYYDKVIKYKKENGVYDFNLGKGKKWADMESVCKLQGGCKNGHWK